jgi:hypothetical protein
MSFAITATGRSGTKFLAAIMNRSKEWCVMHETSKQLQRASDIPAANERLAADYYGEVNGYLRNIFLRLEVERTGVIVRNPSEVTLSWYNRRLSDKQWSLFVRAFSTVDAIVQAGSRLIRFEEMVSSPRYLQAVLTDFGITDVYVTKELCKGKINATSEHRRSFGSFQDLSESVRRRFHDDLDWYAEKYGYGERNLIG